MGGRVREQRVVVGVQGRWQGGLEATLREGLPQTSAYMEPWGADEGHLVVFDRGSDRSWDKKVFRREEEWEGRAIGVWGM